LVDWIFKKNRENQLPSQKAVQLFEEGAIKRVEKLSHNWKAKVESSEGNQMYDVELRCAGGHIVGGEESFATKVFFFVSAHTLKRELSMRCVREGEEADKGRKHSQVLQAFASALFDGWAVFRAIVWRRLFRLCDGRRGGGGGGSWRGG
jgi:hypothetical protein